MTWIVLPRLGKSWDRVTGKETADHVHIGNVALDAASICRVEAFTEYSDRCWVSYAPQFGMHETIEIGLPLNECLDRIGA